LEKILIDGYNLLHKDSTLKSHAKRSLEEARDRLIAAVAAYRSGDTEIVLVFDGRGGGVGVGAPAPGVRIRFACHPQSADQLILELIEREGRKSRLTVVTSDWKDIGRIARAEGVRCVSSESFLRRLRNRPGRTPVETDKPNGLSPEEMDYWMRRFGSKEERGDDGPPGSGRPSGTPRVSRRPSPISPRRRRSR
jgi:uncharacterized protein